MSSLLKNALFITLASYACVTMPGDIQFPTLQGDISSIANTNLNLVNGALCGTAIYFTLRSCLLGFNQELQAEKLLAGFVLNEETARLKKLGQNYTEQDVQRLKKIHQSIASLKLLDNYINDVFVPCYALFLALLITRS